MKISGSILGIKNKSVEEIKKFYNSGIDLIHIDVMDGIFVPNKSLEYEETKNITTEDELLDVHLMVDDVKKYVNDYIKLKPNNITFHIENKENTIELINYIKNNNIKVGIAIKPSTDIKEIIPYLDMVDLVLVMTVEPGLGGQKLLENTLYKIDELYELKDKYQFEIEADGGINLDTIEYLKKLDIAVIGSYITNGNYHEQIEKIKAKIK